MKNLTYFPFVRNRYFYGKLLSVEDFETEQRYMNNKRRLLNRFLYGTGVVCGMQIVGIDSMTISLEKGLALDFSGREIVVSESVTKQVSEIEGFPQAGELDADRKDLYLCISYDEQPEQQVYNITDSEGQGEYNKYKEGYRLFVTKNQPDRVNSGITALYESTQLIYDEDGIRIYQTVPKYIKSGETTELMVFIEKLRQKGNVSFSYRMLLSGMEQAENNEIKVNFNENDYTAADNYTLKIPVQARLIEPKTGYVENIRDSFELKIDEEIKRAPIQGKFAVSIIDTEPAQAVIQKYWNTAMDELMENTEEEPIYLAKMEVIRVRDTYVIKTIKNLPYKQFVWNNVLSGTLETLKMGQQRKKDIYGVSQVQYMEKSGVVRSGPEIRTGSAWIDLGIGGMLGQCFYSKDIVHGLGLGPVHITLGVVKENQRQGFFGESGIFADEKECEVELAAKADYEKGSFVIGVRCLKHIKAEKIQVSWMAVNDTNVQKKAVKTLTIHPDILNINVREGHYFEAKIGDEVQKNIKWSVKEPDGGTVDANGYYTAPNQTGVFEVLAESMDDASLKAGVFVLVRNAYN